MIAGNRNFNPFIFLPGFIFSSFRKLTFEIQTIEIVLKWHKHVANKTFFQDAQKLATHVQEQYQLPSQDLKITPLLIITHFVQDQY